RANGKLIAIDGGFCKAYHHSTGIAGYTMFFNSWGIRLAEHEPFQGIEYVIKENKDIISTTVVYESTHKRLTVGDTDIGKELRNQIDDLMLLLKAYHHSTGIAGYTMFFNSWGIRLAEHEPFQGIEYVIKENKDIISTTVVYESTHKRLTVGDTDIGKELRNQIDDLMLLLNAYRAGLIVERK
ncbi:MAG: fructose-bisphosphatase class III, partial [Bacilli bacterium]